MAASATTHLDSWSKLAMLAQKCADGTWIFRGEGTAGNPLKPKAGRVGDYRGAARRVRYKLADEKRSLELFKRQARPHLTPTPASDLEWLAVAQHHGMSTRLLDWTESILVAAFFATQEAGTKGDGVIYGVRNLRTLTKAEEKKPFSIRSPGIYHPPHIAPRIPAQRSVFTVHADPTVEFSAPGLTAWRVSHTACTGIKRVLDTCAINEGSLFPDVDGLSRYIAWRYKWGKP